MVISTLQYTIHIYRYDKFWHGNNTCFCIFDTEYWVIDAYKLRNFSLYKVRERNFEVHILGFSLNQNIWCTSIKNYLYITHSYNKLKCILQYIMILSIHIQPKDTGLIHINQTPILHIKWHVFLLEEHLRNKEISNIHNNFSTRVKKRQWNQHPIICGQLRSLISPLNSVEG